MMSRLTASDNKWLAEQFGEVAVAKVRSVLLRGLLVPGYEKIICWWATCAAHYGRLALGQKGSYKPTVGCLWRSDYHTNEPSS